MSFARENGRVRTQGNLSYILVTLPQVLVGNSKWPEMAVLTWCLATQTLIRYDSGLVTILGAKQNCAVERRKLTF